MGISETMKALADPVRRNILEMLKSGPKSAGEIAQVFDLQVEELFQLKEKGERS